MLNPPTLPWPVRLAALAVAVGLSLYMLQIYVFGVKFAAVVGALSRPEAAAPAATGEPGVVPVSILSDSKPVH